MSIGDSVYNNLRSNIIELNIKPGEMISIKDICEQMSVSRSPVRDALIKLEKEGLITSMPQKGTMVSKIDLGRVVEERYLRECLEEKTVKLFIKQHNESDIMRLKRVIEKQKESIVNMDFREFLQHDDEFHKIFFDVTKKELCWQTIQSMSGHYRRIRLLTSSEQGISQDVIKQHQEIIRCITENKAEELGKVINRHLTKLNTEALHLLKKYPELFEAGDKIEEQSNHLMENDFFKMLK